MQPDLKSKNAESLEVSFAIPLSNEQVSELRLVAKPNQNGESIFFDSYKDHRVLAIVKDVDKNSKEYNVEFTFEALKGGRLPKKLNRVSQLMKILGVTKGNLDYETETLFIFQKNQHAKSIITLPMMYIEAPDSPFDKIQGIHLTKSYQGETKYDVYLDAPEPGVLFENVNFKYCSAFSENLPENILEEALIISQKIVLKEKKSE